MKPRRVEVILLVIATLFLFLTDLLQNKYLDNGLEHKVHFISSVTIKALTLFWYSFAIYLILALILFAYAINKKKTSSYWDILFSGIGIFGICVILLGAVGGIYSTTFPFFGGELAQITMYHLFGILPQIIMLLYFAVTD